MSAARRSENWQSLANLRPRLKQHVQIIPQTFRRVRWYIVKNESTGQFLRFNEPAFAFIDRLDGKHTVAQAVASMPETDALDQDEVEQILSTLTALDMLSTDVVVPTQKLVERLERKENASRLRRFSNPLSISLPLLDPDRFLNRTAPRVRPLFCQATLTLWLVVVLLAVFFGIGHADAIAASVNRDLLSTDNLVLMVLVFILIKACHEFAHAFAVKVWGGEVHEMGISLLVFAPVPYVDASAAWAFTDKRKRMLVSAIGIMTEMFLAALAFFLWLLIEPGLLKDALFNAFLIGTVSTLLFNANPLLRFDGYYVLQDAIEIPNLASRAQKHYVYLAQRYLAGIKDCRQVATTRGETTWFTVYGAGAFLYRMLLLFAIVSFLVDDFLIIGVILSVWVVVKQLLLPLYQGLHFLITSPKLSARRPRLLAVSAAVTVTVAGLLFAVPVGQSSHSEGVVWVSEQARLFSASAGFVDEILVEPGTHVAPQTPLIRMRSPELTRRIEKAKAEQRELQVRADAEFVETHGRSQITQQNLKMIAAEIALLQDEADGLVIRSQNAGTLVLPDKPSLKGRYLKQGDFIGYVFNPDELIVNAAVSQSDIGLLREGVESVEVRLAEQLNTTFSAVIARETPAGRFELPSAALGTAGGGTIAVSTRDESGTTAAEAFFPLELKFQDRPALTRVGGRAFIRVNHAARPLATQWATSARQLLLGRL